MGQLPITWRLSGRVLIRPGPIVVLLLTLALGASDWPWGVLNTFWNKHQVIASIATSVAFVAIAIAIIDAWHSETDEQRWRRVSNISYKALIQSVRASRDGLVMLIEGEYPFSDVADERPAIDPAIPHEGQAVSKGSDRRQALDALMQRPAWVDAAYRTVRAMQLEGRHVLGHWAPLMVASDRLAVAFNRVGLFTDAVEDLERPLYPVHRNPPYAGAITDPNHRDAAARLWDQLITTAVKVEEALTTEMGRKGWTTRARLLLSIDGQSEVAEGDEGDKYALSDGVLNKIRDEVRDQYPPSYEIVAGTQSVFQSAAGNP
jgi:hypothetical protein